VCATFCAIGKHVSDKMGLAQVEKLPPLVGFSGLREEETWKLYEALKETEFDLAAQAAYETG